MKEKYINFVRKHFKIALSLLICVTLVNIVLAFLIENPVIAISAFVLCWAIARLTGYKIGPAISAFSRDFLYHRLKMKGREDDYEEVVLVRSFYLICIGLVLLAIGLAISPILWIFSPK